MPIDPPGEVPRLSEFPSYPPTAHLAQIMGGGEDHFSVQRTGSVVADFLQPERPAALGVELASVQPRRCHPWSDVIEHSGCVGIELARAVIQQVRGGQTWSFGAFLDHGPLNVCSTDRRYATDPAYAPMGEERVVLQGCSLDSSKRGNAAADSFRNGRLQQLVRAFIHVPQAICCPWE